MISKSTDCTGTGNNPVVPSRNALRLLRRLALAGSTVGSFCTVAAITYDMHRRVRIAERIVENKRALQTSAPNYDATAAAKRLSRMMEAAEAGEFKGAESLREDNRRLHQAQQHDEVPSFEGEGRGIPSQPESSSELTQLDVPHAFEPMMDTDLSKPLIRYTVTDRKLWKATRGRIGPSSPTEAGIRALLNENRPIDAAQLFLDVHPASMHGISSERRNLAIWAFFQNCEEGNVYVARSIFDRLEEVDIVSQHMWRTLMFELAKKGAVESTAALFTKYRLRFSLPPEMVDIVLRCLLESHRLTTAKWVLLRNLHVDRDCGLCGAYLTGLWKKTGSIELINGQLKKLLTTLPQIGKQPSDKLFNPVIKAYIDFGRFKDAEALVNDMAVVYDLPIHCRTMGLLVYSKALQCDWKAVEDGLRRMHEGHFTKRRRDFIPVFDRIFLEYWVSHSGADIRHFLYRSIDGLELVPDRVLYKHILEAFVEKGDANMIAEITNMARERAWNIKVNEEEFLEMLRARRLGLEDGPVGFWHMLQAARVKHGQAASSQHILGFDQRSFPSSDVNKMPFTQAPMNWYERSLQEMTPSKSVDQYQKLHKQMAHYMHVGKMVEAFKCFESAKRARFHVKQIHVEFAAMATIIEHGIGAARDLINKEWQAIRHKHSVRAYPEFFRRVQEVDDENEAEHLKMAVIRFYFVCLSNKKMTVKHHITVAICRRLISLRKSDIALNLLSAIYMSFFRDLASFDTVCLKMFVRAFCELESFAGIRWSILTGLAQSGTVTWDFVVEVRRVLGVVQRAFRVSLHIEARKQLEYLDHLANLLEKKSQQDTNAWELQFDPAKQQLSQESPSRPVARDEKILYQKSDIRDTLETWNGRSELEAVLRTIDGHSAAGGRPDSNTNWGRKMSGMS